MASMCLPSSALCAQWPHLPAVRGGCSSCSCSADIMAPRERLPPHLPLLQARTLSVAGECPWGEGWVQPHAAWGEMPQGK